MSWRIAGGAYWYWRTTMRWIWSTRQAKRRTGGNENWRCCRLPPPPWAKRSCRETRDDGADGLSHRLRGLLHCTVDFVADSGDAQGQAGRGSVRAVVARFPVCNFRATGATSGVCASPADAGNVRRASRGGVGFPTADGICHQTESCDGRRRIIGGRAGLTGGPDQLRSLSRSASVNRLRGPGRRSCPDARRAARR